MFFAVDGTSHALHSLFCDRINACGTKSSKYFSGGDMPLNTLNIGSVFIAHSG